MPPEISIECGMIDLSWRGSTYHVFVGHYFEEQHQQGDQMQEVSDELEYVHLSRVVYIITISCGLNGN